MAKAPGMYLSDLNLQLAKLRLEQKILSESSGCRRDAAVIRAQTNKSSTVASTAASVGDETATNQVSKEDDASLKAARVELAVLLGDKEKSVLMGEGVLRKEVARLHRAHFHSGR